MAEGYGVLLKSDLGRLEGTFKAGLLEGQACEYFSDGSYYLGNFKAGLRHGLGEYHGGAIGLKFKGTFLRGKAGGFGVLTYPSGDVFEGNFEDNKRQGWGTLRKPDGTIVQGTWLGDLLHGLVTIDKDSQR